MSATGAEPGGLPDVPGFELLELLGSGGMGLVYRARQRRPERDVALKLVRGAALSEATLRRFELEAEVLARLSHPGIARIYETGTLASAQGSVPYFAMELVEGSSLRRFAREQQLSIEGRLELLAKLCAAIQHAHQKGVIHRDLKPANILVTPEGQPKVLDFGVARLTAERDETTLHTKTGEVVGTLAYMSPEQVSGGALDVDTRSDVYSLGVLAYELLSDTLPHDVGRMLVHQAARAIAEDEPTSLGALRRGLRGDVETIVQKAMAKDRERRYDSAEELASDIHRFLADEPIVARPPSLRYQSAKFARRNRVLVAGLAGVFLALIAGTAASTTLYFEKEARRAEAESTREKVAAAREREREARLAAERSRERERRAREQAQDEAGLRQEMFTRFVEMLAAPNPWRAGVDLKVLDVLERTARESADVFPDRPLLRAEYLVALGSSFGGLGDNRRAIPLLREAYELWTGAGGNPVRAAEIATELGTERFETGEVGGLEQIEEALAILEREGASRKQRARTAGRLASAYARSGRSAEAVEIGRKAYELASAANPPDAILRVTATKSVGDALQLEGRYAEALETFERGLRITDELEADTLFEINLRNSRVGSLVSLGRLEEARVEMEEVLAAMRRLGGARHPHYAIQLSNAGVVNSKLGRFEEAEALFHESLELARELDPLPNPNRAVTTGHLGAMYRTVGRLDDALEWLTDAREQLSALYGADHFRYADATDGLALTLLDLGRFEEARELLEEALAIRGALYPEGHPLAARSHLWLAATLLILGADEESLAEHAVARRELAKLVATDIEAVVLGDVNEGLALALAGQPAAGVERVAAARERVTAERAAAWTADYAEAALALCELAVPGGDPGSIGSRFDAALASLRSRVTPWDTELHLLVEIAARFEERFPR